MMKDIFRMEKWDSQFLVIFLLWNFVAAQVLFVGQLQLKEMITNEVTVVEEVGTTWENIARE